MSTVVAKGAAAEPEHGRRDWRDPFTARIWRGLPGPLADALDALVATTTPQEHRRWAAVREQVGSALRIYAQRGALARARDELYAGDDGLLPASSRARRCSPRARQDVSRAARSGDRRGRQRPRLPARAGRPRWCRRSGRDRANRAGGPAAMRTHAIETTDIVKVSKRGRLFHAVVRGRGPDGQLLVEPIERNISHRHVSAREIVDHCTPAAPATSRRSAATSWTSASGFSRDAARRGDHPRRWRAGRRARLVLGAGAGVRPGGAPREHPPRLQGRLPRLRRLRRGAPWRPAGRRRRRRPRPRRRLPRQPGHRGRRAVDDQRPAVGAAQRCRRARPRPADRAREDRRRRAADGAGPEREAVRQAAGDARPSRHGGEARLRAAACPRRRRPAPLGGRPPRRRRRHRNAPRARPAPAQSGRRPPRARDLVRAGRARRKGRHQPHRAAHPPRPRGAARVVGQAPTERGQHAVRQPRVKPRAARAVPRRGRWHRGQARRARRAAQAPARAARPAGTPSARCWPSTTWRSKSSATSPDTPASAPPRSTSTSPTSAAAKPSRASRRAGTHSTSRSSTPHKRAEPRRRTGGRARRRVVCGDEIRGAVRTLYGRLPHPHALPCLQGHEAHARGQGGTDE